MTKEKDLIALGAKLTRLGMTVESRRNKLRQLVEKGVPYESPQMLQALQEFQQADAEWKQTEAAYLDLRKELAYNLAASDVL